jgi:hypothetical protein
MKHLVRVAGIDHEGAYREELPRLFALYALQKIAAKAEVSA